MSEIWNPGYHPKRRKRALSNVFQDENGRPFHGENWRKKVYHSLDPNRKEIRVLVLSPSGYLDSDIVCHLIEHDLDQDDIAFEAISYVWGDQAVSRSINLDGFNIQIGANAYTALRNTRHPQESRLVWIDALCINQADLLERNRQVQLMKYIYSRASRVLFCVCEPWRYAVVATREILEALPYWSDVLPLPKYNIITPTIQMGLKRFEQTTDKCWKSISEFTEEPFWRRLWIVQEITLGSSHARATVLIGRSEIEFDSIWKGVGYFMAISQTTTTTSAARAEATRSCFGFGNRRVISERSERHTTMYIGQACLQVSDDKDRIYGLLALFPELASEPDYQKTTEQIYEDATAAMIDKSGSLECMACIASTWTMTRVPWHRGLQTLEGVSIHPCGTGPELYLNITTLLAL